jgi:hypothetical protein
LVQHTKTAKIYQKEHKMHQVTIKCTKWQQNGPNGLKICQHLPLQDTPKFTQMVIFGLKIYHLATMHIGSDYSLHRLSEYNRGVYNQD